MKSYHLKAYTVRVKHAGRRWEQLVLFYQDPGPSHSPSQDEVRSALGQMIFGVEPGSAGEISCVAPTEEVAGPTLTFLRAALAVATQTLPQNLAQPTFEYLVFGRGQVPREMSGIPCWDPDSFALEAAKFYYDNSWFFDAIWDKLGKTIALPEEQPPVEA